MDIITMNLLFFLHVLLVAIYAIIYIFGSASVAPGFLLFSRSLRIKIVNAKSSKARRHLSNFQSHTLHKINRILVTPFSSECP